MPFIVFVNTKQQTKSAHIETILPIRCYRWLRCLCMIKWLLGYSICSWCREVNNRSTGWANSTCPLPKIAHPVNDLAHRKIGTTIIKNRQFRPKSLQNWLTPKGKHHSSTPEKALIGNTFIVCPEICSVSVVGQYQSSSWNPTLCISWWWHWRGDTKFPGKTHYLG